MEAKRISDALRSPDCLKKGSTLLRFQDSQDSRTVRSTAVLQNLTTMCAKENSPRLLRLKTALTLTCVLKPLEGLTPASATVAKKAESREMGKR
jgi:hypothetical protein